MRAGCMNVMRLCEAPPPGEPLSCGCPERDVTDACLADAAAWMRGEALRLELSRFTLHRGVSLLLRYACARPVRRDRLRAAAAAALTAASKVDEDMGQDLQMKRFAKVGVSPRDVREEEIEMLEALEFRVAGPTLATFLEALLPGSPEAREAEMYADLAAISMPALLLKAPASLVAHAAAGAAHAAAGSSDAAWAFRPRSEWEPMAALLLHAHAAMEGPAPAWFANDESAKRAARAWCAAYEGAPPERPLVRPRRRAASEGAARMAALPSSGGALLGKGTYAAVRRGSVGGVACALKRSPASGRDDNGCPESAVREMGALRLMSPHPCIVSVMGVWLGADICTVALELAPEGSLASYLDGRISPLPEDVLTRMGRDMFEGLAHVHAHGLVHRDLSLNNLLYWPNAGALKISDFGGAGFGDARGTREYRGAYTALWYRSPEQLLGSLQSVSYPTDIWSAGAVLLHMALTKRAKFPLAGSNEVDQIMRTGALLGAPNALDRGNGRHFELWQDDFPAFRATLPALLTEHVPPRAAAIVAATLVWNPATRVAARDAASALASNKRKSLCP